VASAATAGIGVVEELGGIGSTSASQLKARISSQIRKMESVMSSNSSLIWMKKMVVPIQCARRRRRGCSGDRGAENC